MNNRRSIISGISILLVLTVSVGLLISLPKQSEKTNLSDEALLALIKNDLEGFKRFLDAGGNIQDKLPLIDGKIYTVAQGTAYFERPSFMKTLNDRNISFVEQSAMGEFDIVTLAISKNNPELFSELVNQKVNYQLMYGKKGWSLLHLASSVCAHKLTPMLHEKGELQWDLKAKDGSTPLTIAAESECLSMLSYWKEQKANFNQKDGRGLSALSILRKKKDAALLAFAESFESRKLASAPAEVNFYKKRKIPKDQIVDHSALIEPEERPLEATETAEYSEFAD